MLSPLPPNQICFFEKFYKNSEHTMTQNNQFIPTPSTIWKNVFLSRPTEKIPQRRENFFLKGFTAIFFLPNKKSF